MNGRRTSGDPIESAVERRIREAQERGDFDHLPGAGRPIADLDRPRDELWWVRRKLADEGLGYTPPAIEARRVAEQARAAIDGAPSEDAVRVIVADANTRIRTLNRAALHGPSPTVMPFDVDDALRRWRAR